MNWRELADHIERSRHNGDNSDKRDKTPAPAPFVPFVPIVPRASATNPGGALASWRECLAGVDCTRPPQDWTAKRWRLICDDAAWLLDSFGAQAARCAWSTADLFGLWPGKPHWGGIADRLRGARSLVMDADRASWRQWGVVDRFNRGSYPNLQPFWDARR